MAGRSKKKAETIFLVCEETGDYNYAMKRKPGGEKLSLKKYSPRLRRHTVHLEKKKKVVRIRRALVMCSFGETL